MIISKNTFNIHNCWSKKKITLFYEPVQFISKMHIPIPNLCKTVKYQRWEYTFLKLDMFQFYLHQSKVTFPSIKKIQGQILCLFWYFINVQFIHSFLYNSKIHDLYILNLTNLLWGLTFSSMISKNNWLVPKLYLC